MRPTILLTALYLAGCKTEEPIPDDTLRVAYLEATCRFYVTGSECSENFQTNCGTSNTFDTLDECVDVFLSGIAGCDNFKVVFAQVEPAVQDCIDQMNGFDCATGLACDGDPATTNVTTSGLCASVDDLAIDACP